MDSILLTIHHPIIIFSMCKAVLHSIPVGTSSSVFGKEGMLYTQTPRHPTIIQSGSLMAIHSIQSAIDIFRLNSLVGSYGPRLRTACTAVCTSYRDIFALDSSQSCQPFERVYQSTQPNVVDMPYKAQKQNKHVLLSDIKLSEMVLSQNK